MSKEIQIFKNDEFGQVRGILINDEPYFIGKEVAEVLGYANSKDAIQKHVDEEDKQIIQRSQFATLEIPNRGLTIINESGLYSLILSSKLPNAKKLEDFKDNAPLFNSECDELMDRVKSVATKILGYKTPAYNDKSLRGRVYSDMQHQLRREFGVKKYKAIKRCQLSKAFEIVNNYVAPTVLIDEITRVNNQVSFEEAM